jgi:hypothetical protein
LASPAPSDSWNAGHWGFFVFDMRPEHADSTAEASITLFTVDLRTFTLASVKLVTTDPAHAEAEVADLHDAEQRQVLPLPSDW